MSELKMISEFSFLATNAPADKLPGPQALCDWEMQTWRPLLCIARTGSWILFGELLEIDKGTFCIPGKR